MPELKHVEFLINLFTTQTSFILSMAALYHELKLRLIKKAAAYLPYIYLKLTHIHQQIHNFPTLILAFNSQI